VADLGLLARLRGDQDRVNATLLRGVLLTLGGHDLRGAQPSALARLVLPGLMSARAQSWGIGMDIMRAFAPHGDPPEVKQPSYASAFLVKAFTQVLFAPVPTPAKLAVRTIRHAEQANRETVRSATIADRRAQGWARVPGGSECAFCLMLVSRGPVYSEKGGAFEAHDRCRCSAVPVYGADWPGREEYERASTVYATATRGVSSGGQLAALRQHQRKQQDSGEDSTT
jgi:hypothetical protein